jgi:hypothetical protein
MAADAASARIYADPRLAREHRQICRLITTILMWRGLPEDEAKRQAEELLCPAPARRRRSEFRRAKRAAGWKLSPL